MAPKRSRKYPTEGKKTTTKEGKKIYQRQYMRDYRKNKQQVLVKDNDLQRLREQWPDAYDLIFGRTQPQPKKQSKKRKTK